MLAHIIDHKNCTILHEAYSSGTTIEMIILILILVYIILFNASVVIVTIGSAELRGCLFSMQLAASYVGNIFAGASLLGNDIYYSTLGIPPICQKGKDAYVFLYFGNGMNMIILVLNTYYRYRSISSIKRRKSQRAVQTKDIVFKRWLPALFASLCLCIIAVIIQTFVIDYQFLISIGMCVLPITFTIIWNFLLGRRLKIGRINSKIVARSQSIQVLDRATFIINATLTAHISFLIVSVAAVVCSLFYSNNESIVIGISWLLRASYLMLFTIEGHVYLSKVKTARDVIKRKYLTCFQCEKKDEREEKDNEESVEITLI